jgi:hypothetical protein
VVDDRPKLAVAQEPSGSHTEGVQELLHRRWRSRRQQYHVPAILIASVGIGVCLVSLAGFVAMVATNNLPWHPGWTIQDHYLEIGRSYSQGFVIGFFLCFFLIMGAVSVAALVHSSRQAAAPLARRPPTDHRAA